MDINLDAEIHLWQEKLLKRSFRRSRKLAKIESLVGKTGNLQCLEISSGDGLISSHLRSLGGSWKTAAATESAVDSINYSINEKITLIENGKLSFEDNTFDIVVIVDALKGIAADHDFIQECHRVLKGDGWVVISTEYRRPISITALLQRLLGVSPVARGAKRNGYTTHELYNILKDGFDVPETTLYSNGVIESVATAGEFVQNLATHDHYWLVRKKAGQEELYRYRRLYSFAGIAYPLLWILSLFEFLPGHKLLVKSRRRPWRPRTQPRLVDGRSIAEATINTKIGTAAPF
ncbi:MAG: methyltransferase domain-containing protein [Verrucomicrobiota bacterium]